MKLIVTSSLHAALFKKDRSAYRLLSTRPLRSKEVVLARRLGLRRCYLPRLNSSESGEFFAAFDEFWDQVIAPFGKDHFFWRNGLSSKMQEWERSIGQIALMVFTLTKYHSFDGIAGLVIVCSSQEERELFLRWAEVNKIPYSANDRGLGGVLAFGVQEFQNTAAFVLKCGKIFLRKLKLAFLYRPPSLEARAIDDLILSAFYDASWKEKGYEDPFFGTLHRDLAAQGRRVVYLNDCLSEIHGELLGRIKKDRDVVMILPYALVSFFDLFRIFARLFFRRIPFTSCRFLGYDFSALLSWNARRFSENWNFHAEVYYAAVSRLCRRYAVGRVIQLFEGNVQERACLQAVRRYSSARVVGYSHGVLFRSNLKLRATERERQVRPEPDEFVCTGPYAKEWLSRVGLRPSERMRTGCSLRPIPQRTHTEDQPSAGGKVVLVALEGFHSAAILLDWLLEHADRLKGYEVRLRGHPNVPIETLMHQCLQDMPAHYAISHNDLARDIEESFCVLYRHTSIGMQALLNGRPAVHLAVDTPLSGDPIEALTVGKWVVTKAADLPTVLEEISRLSEAERRSILQEAASFVRDYFRPPTPENRAVFFAGAQGNP